MDTWGWRKLTAAEPALLELEREALRAAGGRWARTSTPLRHRAVWRAAWRRLRACSETGSRPGGQISAQPREPAMW